jgi:hypothetical protein
MPQADSSTNKAESVRDSDLGQANEPSAFRFEIPETNSSANDIEEITSDVAERPEAAMLTAVSALSDGVTEMPSMSSGSEAISDVSNGESDGLRSQDYLETAVHKTSSDSDGFAEPDDDKTEYE